MHLVRIGMIAPPWAPIPPRLYGGIETVVDQLTRGLVAAGHDVTLYTTGDSTCPVKREFVLAEAEGMRIGMAVPELRHVVHAYDALTGYDVIHDHTVAGPLYCERFPDLPVATTVHGPFNDELLDLYRRVVPRVSLICVSGSQRASAPDLSVARVIHHGIEAREFPMGTGSGGYALFLGRMAPEKGAHRAIDAARKAGVPLMLAGKMRESWEMQYFASEVEPRLGGDIQWLGEVAHQRKVELLGEASALLFPIRWAEPFGMVMIEAMACGTPVIAFPEGAAPEVVDPGRTGFLCGDETEMAEALSQIGTIDRNACRQAVETRFSVSRMVDDHISLFNDMIAQYH